MSEPTGTFGGIWISDDRTELAVEIIDDDGATEVVIMQVWRDEGDGDRAQPLVTDAYVQPEVLDRGWTYFPPS